MKVARTLLSFCALGLAGSAFAVDYPEERGLVPSVIPAAPDESGIVRNVPRWSDDVDRQVGADRRVEGYSSRYESDRAGAVPR
jgi:hypothetical protein